MLSPDEIAIYEGLLGDVLARSDVETAASLANLVKPGGAVGYDNADRLVITLPGGGVEVIVKENQP